MPDDWKIKRFIVFESEYYYPIQGWGDFRDSFDTLYEAQRLAPSNPHTSCMQIVDLKLGRIIGDEENEKNYE
jgi:hypothetical protein